MSDAVVQVPGHGYLQIVGSPNGASPRVVKYLRDATVFPSRRQAARVGRQFGLSFDVRSVRGTRNRRVFVD